MDALLRGAGVEGGVNALFIPLCLPKAGRRTRPRPAAGKAPQVAWAQLDYQSRIRPTDCCGMIGCC